MHGTPVNILSKKALMYTTISELLPITSFDKTYILIWRFTLWIRYCISSCFLVNRYDQTTVHLSLLHFVIDLLKTFSHAAVIKQWSLYILTTTIYIYQGCTSVCDTSGCGTSCNTWHILYIYMISIELKSLW